MARVSGLAGGLAIPTKGFRVTKYIQYQSLATKLGDPSVPGCGWQALQPSRACLGLADRSAAPAYPFGMWGGGALMF